MLSPSEALKLIEIESKRVLKNNSVNFHSDLIRASPVALINGGSFRGAWEINQTITG